MVAGWKLCTGEAEEHWVVGTPGCGVTHLKGDVSRKVGRAVGKSVRELIATYQAVAGMLTSRFITESTRKHLEMILVQLDREILEAQIRDDEEHERAA